MQDKPTLNDALEMLRDLRARCDWDRAQTHESLRPYLIEEMHEFDEAIRAAHDKDNAHAVLGMRDELGDVLLQVLFHCVISEESGEFDAGDVAHALISKMKRRHPHLFGEGQREPWETMKSHARKSIADGLPAGLPALHRAHRLQERAAGVGFDWSDTEGPALKVEEELAEVRALLSDRIRTAAPDSSGDQVPVFDEAHSRLEAELGDLLFACVNLCRRAG
ncbi:MAG: MazG nucleotide pyrophosphohydrolase domain-containing protein, partial [Gemmatimonadaceae bacterium]